MKNAALLCFILASFPSAASAQGLNGGDFGVGPGGIDMSLTNTCIVSANGIDNSACGSAQAPCLTVQKGIDNCAPAPTTQADYLDTGTVSRTVIVRGNATFTENVTFRTRRSVKLIFEDTATLNGSVTIDLRNSDRFGSNAGPIYQFEGSHRGTATAPQIGAIIFTNAIGNAITQGCQLRISDLQVNGAVSDTNSNTNVSVQAGGVVFSSTITLTTASLTFSSASSTFGGAVNVTRWARSNDDAINASVTVTTAPLGTQGGFKDAQFTTAGTFTGPAGSFVADANSQYTFSSAGWTLAGGATLVLAGATGVAANTLLKATTVGTAIGVPSASNVVDTTTETKFNKPIVGIPQAVTCADNAAGTSPDCPITPTSETVLFTCSDTDGCTAPISEVGAVNGQFLFVVNVSANVVTFADTTTVTETAGTFAAGLWDNIAYRYVIDRWVEVSRKDN